MKLSNLLIIFFLSVCNSAIGLYYTTTSYASYCGVNMQTNSIAFDESGNYCISGSTDRNNDILAGGSKVAFPFQDAFDIYLICFNSTNQLIYGTFYGGPGLDGFYDSASASSVLYHLGDSEFGVIGFVNSGDQVNHTSSIGTLGGSSIAFATFSLENGYERAFLIGGDSEDNPRGSAKQDDKIYIVGLTASSNFPVTPDADQSTFGGETDAFLLILNENGTLEYATYLGESGFDEAKAVAVGNDHIYVVGETSDASFPTTEPVYGQSTSFSLLSFIAAYDPAGVRVYTRLVGGELTQAFSVLFDQANGVYYSLFITSDNTIPTTTGPVFGGQRDVLVLQSNVSDNSITVAYFFGGAGSETLRNAQLINENLVINGETTIPLDSFPITEDSYQNSSQISLSRGFSFFTTLVAADSSVVYSSLFQVPTDDTTLADIEVGSNGTLWLVGNTKGTNLTLTPDAFSQKLGNPSISDTFLLYLGPVNEESTTGTTDAGTTGSTTGASTTSQDSSSSTTGNEPSTTTTGESTTTGGSSTTGSVGTTGEETTFGPASSSTGLSAGTIVKASVFLVLLCAVVAWAL